jgi:hypothetical protein
MQGATRPALVSNKMLWAGRVLSTLVVMFLLFDSSIKLLQLAPAMEGTIQLGYPASLIRTIGLILLVCTVLYTIPRTSIVGAILLPGYLGGAVTSHTSQLRIGEPLFSHILFPSISLCCSGQDFSCAMKGCAHLSRSAGRRRVSKKPALTKSVIRVKERE